MFDDDEINGQLLAVTHSPYIILDDYKHIVRVYIIMEKLMHYQVQLLILIDRY